MKTEVPVKIWRCSAIPHKVFPLNLPRKPRCRTPPPGQGQTLPSCRACLKDPWWGAVAKGNKNLLTAMEEGPQRGLPGDFSPGSEGLWQSKAWYILPLKQTDYYKKYQ